MRVVSVFMYSLLTTLQRWIGETRYPTKELMNIILVRPAMFIPEDWKNGSTKGYESATAPKL